MSISFRRSYRQKINTPELDDRYFSISRDIGLSTYSFELYKVIEVLDIKKNTYVKCNIILTRNIQFELSLDDNKYHIKSNTIVYDETNRETDIENKYKNCKVSMGLVVNSQYIRVRPDIEFLSDDGRRMSKFGERFDRVYGNGDASSGNETELIIQ